MRLPSSVFALIIVGGSLVICGIWFSLVMVVFAHIKGI